VDDSVVVFLLFLAFFAFFAFLAEASGLVSDFVSVELVVLVLLSSARALKATRTNAASAAAIVRIIVSLLKVLSAGRSREQLCPHKSKAHAGTIGANFPTLESDRDANSQESVLAHMTRCGGRISAMVQNSPLRPHAPCL